MPSHPTSLTEALAFHDTPESAARARADAKKRRMSLAAYLRECLELRKRFNTFDTLDIIDRMPVVEE